MPVNFQQNAGLEQHRYSSIAAHQKKVLFLQRVVSPQQAFNAAQIAQYNPRFDGGVVAGLTMAGITPGDPVMDMMSERVAYAQPNASNFGQDGGILGEWVWNPFKGLIRGVFMGMEGLIQEAESALVRTPVGVMQGMGVGEAFHKSGRSDAFHALNAAMSGKRVHTGGGFFAQDQKEDDTFVSEQLSTGRTLTDVTAQQEYQEQFGQFGVDPVQMGTADREQMMLTHGASGKKTPVSLGRLAAIQVTEPGTTGFHLISGMVDTAKQIVLDPTNLVFAGAGKAAKLRKLPMAWQNIEDANGFVKSARGILLPSHRKAFFARTWDQYLDGESGRGVMKWIQGQTGDEGGRNLFEMFTASQKGAIDGRMIKALRDTDDINLIREILHSAGEGGGISRTFGTSVLERPMTRSIPFMLKQGLDGTYLGRMARVTDSNMLNVADPKGSLAALDNYTARLGLSQAKRDEILNKAMDFNPEDPLYAGAKGEQDIYGHFFGLLKNATDDWVDNVLKIDKDAPMRLVLNKIFKDQTEFRAFWVDNMGNDMMFGGARMRQLVDGEWVTDASPLLFSQFLEHGIPLLDPAAIRGAMNDAAIGRMFGSQKNSKVSQAWLKRKFGDDDWEKFGHGAITDSLDFLMQKAWKPSVLLRVAWPVRVIGEEQFRLGGKLMAGAFNHPMQFIALTFAHKHKSLAKFARMGNDVFNANIMDDAAYEAAMASKTASIAETLTGKTAGRNGTGFRYTSKRVEDMSDEEFVTAMVFELNQLVKDDVAREVAIAVHTKFKETGNFNVSGLDELKSRFWNGDLKHLRTRMLNDSGQFNLLNDKAFAQGYIDTVYGKLHHMGGGRGNLLNPTDGFYYGLDGIKKDAKAVRGLAGQQGIGPPLRSRISVRDPYDPADEIEQAFRQSGVHEDEVRAAMDKVDNLMDRTDELNAGELTLEELLEDVMDYAEETLAKMEGKGKPAAAGALEPDFIPTMEAKTGVGQLSNKDFMGMYQTMPGRQISKANIQYELDDGMTAALSAAGTEQAYVTDLKTLTQATYDELKNSDSIIVELADLSEDAGDIANRTFLHIRNGKPTAIINTSVVDGKMVGVDFAGALDMNDLQKLGAEAEKAGLLDLEQLFGFTAGDRPFYTWLREQGLDVNSNSDVWKLLDEQPDLFQRFYKQDAGAGAFRGGINPREAGLGGTETTKAGTAFNKRAMDRGVQESSEWAQHTPYFDLEDAGDPRIFEMVANGRLTDDAGKTMFDWDMSRGTTNKQVKSQFASRKGYFGEDLSTWRTNSPNYLRQVEATSDASNVSRWDRGISGMMQMLMSKPTDYLSRSPAFRQFYWARASEMAANLNQADRTRFLASADKANLLQAKDAALKLGNPMRTLRRYTGKENTVDEAIRRVNFLAKQPQVIESGGITTLEQLDEVAKAYALAETKRLLYDVSKSHNWSDMMRFVAPFGEAWYEVISTWARLMKENPANIRKLQQGLQGARGSDPFRDVGPDGEQGRGLFYTDPVSGEEVFAYPDASIIPDWMPFIGGIDKDIGEHVTLQGRASGLNIAGNVMPGLGPLLQIPLSQFGFMNEADNRWMRDIALPFGKSTVEGGDASTWLDPLLPGWVNKGLQAIGSGGENNRRLQANTTIDVYKTLLMKGWSDDNPTEMQRTLDEAKRIAQDITRVKALAAFAAPTGIQASFEVKYVPEDRNGDIWAYTNLATAYRQLLEEKNGDEVFAAHKFQQLFGLDPMLFAVSKTQNVIPRAVTLDAKAWQESNSDLFEQSAFPLTAYYAYPDSPDGEFDYETYLLQLKEESRTPLTPEQWAVKRNQFLGRVSYTNFKRMADRRFRDDPMGQVWLRNMHSGLRELFPGYGTANIGMPEKPSLGDERVGQIGELYAWSGEQRLNGTDVGQALATYLRMRDYVVRESQFRYGYSTSTGWRTGVKMSVHRRRLEMLGQSLAAKTPEFVPLWQQILSREIQAVEQTPPPVNLGGVSYG